MKKRNYAVIVSLILTLVCCLTGFAAAKDGPPVMMEVSAIYGDIGKLGVHVPISVKLYGQSSGTFEGTLEIQTLESAAEEGNEVYEYQYPVTIGTAETKNMELYVPLGQKSSVIHVRLLDESGDEIIAKNMTFDISRDMGRLLIGALTNREEDIAYLNGVSLNYGMVQSQMVYLDAKQFPNDVRGLEVLDMLVINRFDTGKLSDKQKDALTAWVKNGGTLLVGTGAMAYRTLDGLPEELVDVSVLNMSYENINLGAEYAENAPGDSDVKMMCAELAVTGGSVEVESDGIPLLTLARCGDGTVGVYSYDLGAIASFVEKNPNYANKVLIDALEEDEISNFYYYSSYGSDTDYWNAYSLVNTGSTERLPNLGMYTIVIGMYVILVGPGLYLFLKKKDMSRLYSVCVVGLSIGVSAVIYLMGVGTRFTSQFFTVASVLEQDGSTVKEQSYMNVRTPDNRPFSITIPADYSLIPLTRTNRYENQPTYDFERKYYTAVDVKFGENETLLSARQSKAFEPRFFKVSKEERVDRADGIGGTLQWYDGKITGSVENHLPVTLKDAALVFYGQIYLLGDLEVGAVRTFDEEPLLAWPVNMSYMVAGELTEHEEIVSYYIGDRFSKASADGYLIGIAPEGGITATESFETQLVDELVLYSAKLNVTSGEDGQIYRSALTNQPEINAGNGAIYSDGLTMYGSEPMLVEYVLGTDMDVEKLSFVSVSDCFVKDPDYYYLKRFDGTVSFYNYTTKSYDLMSLAQEEYDAEELGPYLSSDGHLIVKYATNDSDSMGISSLLPHLMVTGRKR